MTNRVIAELERAINEARVNTTDDAVTMRLTEQVGLLGDKVKELEKHLRWGLQSDNYSECQ